MNNIRKVIRFFVVFFGVPLLILALWRFWNLLTTGNQWALSALWVIVIALWAVMVGTFVSVFWK